MEAEARGIGRGGRPRPLTGGVVKEVDVTTYCTPAVTALHQNTVKALDVVGNMTYSVWGHLAVAGKTQPSKTYVRVKSVDIAIVVFPAAATYY